MPNFELVFQESRIGSSKYFPTAYHTMAVEVGRRWHVQIGLNIDHMNDAHVTARCKYMYIERKCFNSYLAQTLELVANKFLYSAESIAGGSTM